MTLYIVHEISPGGLIGPYREVRAAHPREAAIRYAREADAEEAQDPTLSASLLERQVVVRPAAPHVCGAAGEAYTVTRELRPAYHAREA